MIRHHCVVVHVSVMQLHRKRGIEVVIGTIIPLL